VWHFSTDSSTAERLKEQSLGLSNDRQVMVDEYYIFHIIWKLQQPKKQPKKVKKGQTRKR
jgi:hypothetical protein